MLVSPQRSTDIYYFIIYKCQSTNPNWQNQKFLSTSYNHRNLYKFSDLSLAIQ